MSKESPFEKYLARKSKRDGGEKKSSDHNAKFWNRMFLATSLIIANPLHISVVSASTGPTGSFLQLKVSNIALGAFMHQSAEKTEPKLVQVADARGNSGGGGKSGKSSDGRSGHDKHDSKGDGDNGDGDHDGRGDGDGDHGDGDHGDGDHGDGDHGDGDCGDGDQGDGDHGDGDQGDGDYGDGDREEEDGGVVSVHG